MIREVLTYPDSRLKDVCEEITEITPEIRKLAEDMAETMYSKDGIGLAAPQVGEACRLIVVDVSGPKERTDLMALVNPQVVSADGQTETEEGCLSVSSLRTSVKRHSSVRVEALDMDGNPVVIDAEDLLAVCLQHEIDHLEGVLIVDRISRMKRAFYDKKVKKWQKQAEKSSE